MTAAAHHRHTAKRKRPGARQTVTCVCLLVRLEDPGGDETAPTELALVGLLPSVGPHVLLQVARLLEAFAAVLTPRNSTESTRVSPQHGHRRHIGDAAGTVPPGSPDHRA